MPTAQELDDRFAIPGVLSVRHSERGGPVVVIEGPGSRCQVALLGAQVLSFVPASGEDLLWLSPLARLDTGKPVRGGIPICWPWFGPHPADSALPAHGLVRTKPWTLSHTTVGEDGAVTIALGPEGDLPRPWGELQVGVEIVAGAALKVSLVTRNNGEEASVVSQALHAYFKVGDIARAQIDGLGDREYIDQVGGNGLKRQLGLVTIASETDRVFIDTSDPVTVIDPTFARRIRINKSGSDSTVVWNPWIGKAARLGDVGAEGYRNFVCVEPANAGPNRIVIPPGGTHVLSALMSEAPL